MYLWNHKKWTSFCILIHIFYFKDNVSHARVLFFAYAAQFLRLCPEVICPIIALSNRAEHLLIYRIQSHTYPKRRKFSLKQAGQKSVKEDLPEQRKAPKRAVECQLKVQTHILGPSGREFESPISDQIPSGASSRGDLSCLLRRNFCYMLSQFEILSLRQFWLPFKKISNIIVANKQWGGQTDEKRTVRKKSEYRNIWYYKRL